MRPSSSSSSDGSQAHRRHGLHGRRARSPASSGSTSITSWACSGSGTKSITSRTPRGCRTIRVTLEITNDYSYAADDPRAARARNSASRIAGLSARAICRASRAPGCRWRRCASCTATADAILNVCGAQELNEDLLQSERILYVESDPGVEQILVDKGEPKPHRVPLAAPRALHFRRKRRARPEFPVPLHQFQWLPTRQPVVTDFWKTDAPPPAGARLHLHRELEHERAEGHRVARRASTCGASRSSS